MGFIDALYGLKGSVAVVVGGSGVLGGSMSSALAKAGADVVVGYSGNRDAAEKRVSAILADGGQAIAAPTNTLSETTLEDSLQTILKRFGKVDVVVNAPGVNAPTPFFEIPDEEWERIINTNLRGVFHSCRVFGKQMIAQGNGGSIVNISSVSSDIPLSRVFTYSISKAGVNNMTRFLAREWAPHNIRVNAIVPGFFPAEQNRKILTEERKTKILSHTPMNRYGEPDELSGALLWLASRKASSFVTGAIVPVDGGFTAMTI